MRRIAILVISIVAVMPAFAQKKPAKGAAAATGATGATGAQAAAEPTGPHPRSKEEADALLALMNATDADTRIKAADELLAKFPNTDYKAIAMTTQAEAYHEKRPADDAKAIVVGEDALAADPTSYETRIVLAEIYAQSVKNNDLDKDDKVTKGSKYAKDALDLLGKAEKPAGAPDDAWKGLKTQDEARIYAALSLLDIEGGKYDAGKADLEKSQQLSPEPIDALRTGRAFIDVKRFDDAIAIDDKLAATPGLPDQIKSVANSDKTRAQAMKKAAN